jgi:hypothetical protein
MANETLNEIPFFLNNFIKATDFVKAFHKPPVLRPPSDPAPPKRYAKARARFVRRVDEPQVTSDK